MQSGVYKIIIGKRIYIGSAVNLIRRKIRHLHELKKGIHCNVKMQRAYDKYKSFAFDVVEFCLPEKLMQREQFWIDLYLVDTDLLNICLIAYSNVGVKRSKMVKIKASLRQLGRPCSKATRAKMSKKSRHRGAKKVIQCSKAGVEIKTWVSASEAERKLGILATSIAACARGTRKSAGKFIWKYN